MIIPSNYDKERVTSKKLIELRSFEYYIETFCNNEFVDSYNVSLSEHVSNLIEEEQESIFNALVESFITMYQYDTEGYLKWFKEQKNKLENEEALKESTEEEGWEYSM